MEFSVDDGFLFTNFGRIESNIVGSFDMQGTEDCQDSHVHLLLRGSPLDSGGL